MTVLFANLYGLDPLVEALGEEQAGELAEHYAAVKGPQPPGESYVKTRAG